MQHMIGDKAPGINVSAQSKNALHTQRKLISWQSENILHTYIFREYSGQSKNAPHTNLCTPTANHCNFE